MGIYLGIDIGTSGTKTLAIDADGKILGEAAKRSVPRDLPGACFGAETDRLAAKHIERKLVQHDHQQG